MSMITATAWVQRGFAAPFPTKYHLDDEELERISRLAQLQLKDAKEGLEEARKGGDKESEAEGTDDEDNGVTIGRLNECVESQVILRARIVD